MSEGALFLDMLDGIQVGFRDGTNIFLYLLFKGFTMMYDL